MAARLAGAGTPHMRTSSTSAHYASPELASLSEETTRLYQDSDSDRNSEDSSTIVQLQNHHLRRSSTIDAAKRDWIPGFTLGGSGNSRWNRLLWLSILIALCLFSSLAISEKYTEGTIRISSLFSSATSASATCEDPYSMPGYLLHKWATARWIPYTDEVLAALETADAPAVLPSSRNVGEADQAILDLAPPSFSSRLSQRAKNPLQGDFSDLESFRNKTILLLGCSLDRYFMENFCRSHGAKFRNIRDDWHGMFACDIPDIDLKLQLWFTYGALAGHASADYHGDPHNFEDRVRDYWLPEAKRRNMVTVPDMIIWASGTWDVLGLRMKYAKQKDWKELGTSWQELAWHRQRMHEMISFIREQWPGVPALYRPPTYAYKKDIPSHNGFLTGVRIQDIDQINEGIWRLQQSAEIVTRKEKVPIFRWAELLVGMAEYSDTMHFTGNSYAQTLYGDMMLYYLNYYSMKKPSHCHQPLQSQKQ